MTPTPLPLHAASAERGLTLIELLIALTIGGVLMTGAYYGFNLIHTASGQNVVRLLSQAGTCMRNSLVNRPGYAGVTTSTAIQAGCFPDSNVNGAEVDDGNGHAITVAAANGPGGVANTALAFTVVGPLKPALCSQITLGLIATASSVLVNGQTAKAFGGRVDQGVIDTECAKNPNSLAYIISK